MEFYRETMNTPVAGEYDVFVLGGGVAGIAAALAAARQGKSVLIVEKNYLLGGLATAGLIAIYLPLCDGFGKQVSFGIAEELLRLSIKDWHNDRHGYGYWIAKEPIPEGSEKIPRFEVDFNPWLFALSAEELLLKEGVKILYGTAAVSCIREGNKISAVITENKSGRRAFRAKNFVDASGDCDLAFFSETPTVTFGQGNVLAAWYYSLTDGKNALQTLGACDIPDEEKKEGKKGAALLADRRFAGVTGEELSEMTELSHAVMYGKMKDKLAQNPQNEPLSIPSIPQVRMTRRIAGEETLTGKNCESYFEDSIGLVPDWRKRGRVYEVPFGSLFSSKTVNLICAGRCVSNDDTMWDVLRVIPCCAVTGEAAGIAASLSDDFSALDVRALQGILQSRGVLLHRK